MLGSKASVRRSPGDRLLSDFPVARPGLVKKVQRVFDLHQQTFDFLPLVGPRTFVELFKELLLLCEGLAIVFMAGTPIIHKNLASFEFPSAASRRVCRLSAPPACRGKAILLLPKLIFTIYTRSFSRASVPPKLRQSSVSAPIGRLSARTACKVRVSMTG
jgi:hypothetical protein